MKTRHPLLAIALVLLCATGASAQEHPLGQHPAVIVKARAPGIDPNLFIVAPPASVTWVHTHANGEHPAVAVARRGPAAGVDANTFLVQPPATVTWTQGPAPGVALQLAQTSLQR